MYHTQEKRQEPLTAPVCCKRSDAWLGHGYYFWEDESDAHIWGKLSKKESGYYQIYKGDIVCDNFLDTVYDETHYKMWKEQIEKAATDYKNKTGKVPNIKVICNYIMNVAKWNTKMDGILFNDSPSSQRSLISYFPYRKRIQAVVYKIECVNNFCYYKEQKCS